MQMEQMETLLELMEKLPSEVNVDAVFGEPEKYDDYVLIPVAEITYGYGVGFGTAEGCCCAESAGDCCAESTETADESDSPDTAEGDTPEKTGHGMGGGGIGAKARPIAYIEVGPEGAKVKSIVDEQKIATMGILLSVWAVGWIGLVLKTIFSPRK
jgi:uncharacterized spore protein YtfJ